MKLRTIVIILIIIALGVIIYFGLKSDNKSIEILTKTNIEDINTDLLQVQAKAKVIKDQSIVKNDENLLKGEKIKDSENEEITNLLTQAKEKQLISEEEENFDQYYVWNNTLLEELNLNVNLHGNDKIIVNYNTLEIILPNGINLEKNKDTVYKFSEILNNE